MATSRSEFQIFAVTHVLNSTRAAEAAGDRATFEALDGHYAVVAAACGPAGGRLLKVMGDGTLLVFPPDRPAAVVDALRKMQSRATDKLRRFDERCRVQVKVGIGTVEAGPLGPPGDKRPDIIGRALNRLINLPWADFVVSPELEARLG